MYEEKPKVKKMVKWSEFVASLETTGGAIVSLFTLLVLLFVFSKLGFTGADSQIPIVVGAVLGIVSGKQLSDKKNQQPQPPQQPMYQPPPSLNPMDQNRQR